MNKQTLENINSDRKGMSNDPENISSMTANDVSIENFLDFFSRTSSKRLEIF